MKLEDLRNKKILIVGYGIEGKATHAFLQKVLPESIIGIVEDTNAPDYLQKEKEYDIAVRSPGVHPKLIHIPYTTATNIFFANVEGCTIGITGSKGKSTTSSLTYEILKKAGLPVHLAGNIGVPMLSLLSEKPNSNEYYVCELSSYQLEDIHYTPDIAVVINLFPEHMNFHGNVDAYYEAKKRIVKFATEKTIFIFNPEYKELADLARNVSGKKIPFRKDLPLRESEIPLLGKHNRDNVRAAATVAMELGIKDDDIRDAVKTFKPLPHRLEYIGTFRGIQFFDDAISTAPQSTMCAINSLSPIGTIFLGGQERGYDFSELVDLIKKRAIKHIVLFPDTGAAIKKEIEKRNMDVMMLETKDMEDAVKFAYVNTPPGMICILSTASPSYSVWRNFEEKGDIFQRMVKKLA